MEVALNSDTPGGFKHENAITSQNGLALLASLTLKNALNINNNNKTIKNNNNNHKQKNNNHLILNHNNNNIKHHKVPQPQHGYISSATVVSSAASTSSTATIQTTHLQQQIQEHQNTFTFTTAGLQANATTVTPVTPIKTEGQCGGPSQQNNKLQISLSTVATVVTADALSPRNTNTTSLSTASTNHHQTNNTSSSNDPSVALLEALSIKTTKKQQNVSAPLQQQQQMPTGNSSSAIQSAVGNGVVNNNGNGNSNKNNFKIPSDILDDLASRFIINVPDMELSNLIRICFQIELAHWFYLDFFCASEEEKKLQPCGMKQFALQLFEHIPFLRHHLSGIDKILEDWKNYKLSVPTYGGILISEDLNYCLLVQSYFAKSSWGFPKGKVNENEDPVHCATREVYEETGYDITELIVPNDYIEAVINYQYTRLYIVRDVSLETKFSPRTRNEIKCCDWFPIDSLPVNKNDAISKAKLGINANSFFMIMPFVKRLKKWVNDKRNGVETRRKYSAGSGSPPTSTSPLTTVMHFVNGQPQFQNKSSSCKKQPKHFQHQQRNNSNNINDDMINALNNVGASAQASSCGNNTNTTINNANVIGSNINSNSNSNSNRSKRQRHKSMGDLDGIKLNNFNNCNNNQSNCKSTNNNNNSINNSCASNLTTSVTNSCVNNANNCNNINTNINQKHHSKIVAAGSNVSNNSNISNKNTNNGGNNNNSNVNNSSSKRQLFHSQSQTNNLQQNGERIVSSFDLIRKEKQQMKAAQAKVQKQQQNTNNDMNNGEGRQRAKSQSEKMGMQQQQQQKSNGICNNNKQRIQKQQSMVVTNSNMQNLHINSSNKNNTNGNSKLNVNNNSITGGYKTPTPPPLSGNDLLALAAAAAATTSAANNSVTTATHNINMQTISKQGSSQQQKPRPSSVSLHFPEISLKREPTDLVANNMPQLQRMASGTNLRILKRSTSHQPQQQQQRQAAALQFTPSFNSWTNFTFTKNFIANVFC